MNNNYWNTYYLNTSHESVPWNKTGALIFDAFSNNLKLNDPILDVGCGAGYKMRYLKSLGKKVFGFDFSEEAIRLANDEYAVVGDIRHIRNIFPSIIFNTIIDLLSSQFVSDRSAYIEYLSTILPTGGQILLGHFIPPNEYGKSYEEILEEWSEFKLIDFKNYLKPVKSFNVYLFEKK